MADIFEPWYEEIGEQARGRATLNADETGWRVGGRTHWLWCFTLDDETYYSVERTRSSEAVLKFFGESYQGTLITDFYAAYNAVRAGRKQKCLRHVLAEMEKVSKTNASQEWTDFNATLKRLLKDAFRLGRRTDRAAPDFSSKRRRLERRLMDLCWAEYADPDCARLADRLYRHENSILTFLERPDVEPTNNHAEREIRPAVIARKNSFQNASERGARTQSVLMTVYRTLRRRGHDSLAVGCARPSARTAR